MILSIVIPCYNEEEVIRQSYKVMSDKLNELIRLNLISPKNFLCFVDDGSKDSTWQILNDINNELMALAQNNNSLDITPPPPLESKHVATDSKQFIAIKLSRNCGHQNALLAGLEYVSDKCDYALSIDCDLQDDISVFSEFIQKAKNGAEVIYGVGKTRNKDTFFKKYSALGFYKLMEIMGVKIMYNHADYRLLSHKAIKSLLNFSEVNLFLRGIVPLIGFKSDIVMHDRLERFAGDSKYPLSKMLSFAWNGITSFSIVPLRIVSVLGIIFFLLSIFLGCYALFVKFFVGGVVYGWASTIVPLCFFSGIQLLSLGIIGEYVGKIYAETKRRPRYFVEQII